MSDAPIDPQDEPLDEEGGDEPEEGGKMILGMSPRDAARAVKCKGATLREAERALKKWKTGQMRAAEWMGASEFGEYVKLRGKERFGLAMQVWAADKFKKGVERVEALMEQVEDPELKVRLEESAKGSLDSVAKIGAELCKGGPVETKSTQPAVPPVPAFPANVAVQIVNNTVAEPPKPLDV